MEQMLLLLTPVAALLVAVVAVNGIKLWQQWNYNTHPALFFLVYVGFLGLVLSTPPFPLYASDFFLVALGTLGYVWFSARWPYWTGGITLPETDTFSVPQQDIAPPRFASAFPKALEVLLQDIALLALLLLVFSVTSSLLVAALLLAVLVGLWHAPAPYFFGTFYGWYMLVGATVFALVLPWLVHVWYFWLGELFVVHLLGYGVMYGLAWLRTRTQTPPARGAGGA